ncbi:molecular chaperone LolB [Alcanivorax sp. P2S70]|uniref:Outer-membrane lipoprotein LolB n=1 Tax=Alcanivorax profundi TaxID=2338368 RepID=A0A418XVW2_9GAMM|nr:MULTISPECIES: lipoprotein insertase outer membrane protein LolB [Alcanivorax]ERP90668.1 molecular chaperone LolB [Alcanivorax sp. P2S70]RJG16875.1 outer membrane lipoprotein LolB [Alcanivorax profundi]
MKHRLSRVLIALCIPLILSACQTPTTELTTFTHPSQIQGWEMEGKLGYRTPNDGGSATFEWRQQPARGEIRFSGPLGFGSADLRWDTGRAELITAKEQYQARSPGELAWHLTGFWLPVSALQYWARGLPWPGAPGEASYDDLERLQSLEQLGWTLTFDRYETVAGVELPFRIKATQNGNRFTLLIKDWQPGLGQ